MRRPRGDISELLTTLVRRFLLETTWGSTGTRLDAPEFWKCPGALVKGKVGKPRPRGLQHPYHFAPHPPEAARGKGREEAVKSREGCTREQDGQAWTF